MKKPRPASPAPPSPSQVYQRKVERSPDRAREVGGPKGPEPTRYGDWERNGKCVDF